MSLFNHSAPPEQANIGSFKDLVTKEFEVKESYIEPYLLTPGSTMGIYGDSKVGKSFLLLSLGRALSTGEPLYGNPKFVVPKRKKVILFEQEIGEMSLQNRAIRIMDGVNWEENEFLYVSRNPKLQLNEESGVDLFSEIIADVKPDVILLDPIGKLHGYDENDSTQIGMMFNTFEKFKKINPEKNMAIVFSHHTRKPPLKHNNPMFGFDYDQLDPHNARGSSRFFSDPDTIVTAQKVFSSDTPWEWWRVKLRFELRHGKPIKDLECEVNRHQYKDWPDGDLRVHAIRVSGKPTSPFPVKKDDDDSNKNTNKPGDLF